VAQEARLQVAGKPHAEILEVRALTAQSVREAGVRTPLRSWEAPTTPHAFEPEDTYFALEQRLAAAADRTELRATFGRLGAFPSAPGGAVQGEVLASDGVLTSTLGLGDVGSLREGAVNITRVAPSRRALLGDNHAWRMSAYARMPAGRLAEREALAEFLRLHDPDGVQDEALRVRRPTLRNVGHSQEHDLEDGALTWGDAFDLDVEPEGASRGELRLLGALVQRALSERNEALRFTRLVLRRDGAPLAEYAALAGARFPFPLG
jgi:hypothetical protein